ncbi:hypothetical protein [Prosthecobacter sp.]|uniref:hypothetical protein n=1 Tax=Prosthecobacter sp. TaxID=1965333 RepID=UPI0037850780
MKKISPATALLCALGFNLVLASFAFSLWAEWGPYAWITAAQTALGGSYFGKVSFTLTFILHLVPAILLFFAAYGRVSNMLTLGLPVVCILAHLTATVWFVSTGGRHADGSSFDSAVRSASFVPQDIALERAKLPALDMEKISGIRSGSSDLGADLYVPFSAAAWPDPDTRVILKTQSEKLDKLSRGEFLEGVMQKAPLPYLVRKSWPQNPSVFAIVIEDRGSVRGNWIPALAAYGVLGIWGISHFFKRRRGAAMPKAPLA